MINKKKLSILSLTILAFLMMSAGLNIQSFNHAKNACIANDMTPVADKSLLVFNWSVSCR